MTPSEFRDRVEGIDDMAHEITEEKVKLLHEAGWARTSTLPASLWLWSKSFPESPVQWQWESAVIAGGDPTKKVPHPPFTVNGASLETALQIEASWQRYYVPDDALHAQRETA